MVGEPPKAWQIIENIVASIEHARGRDAGWKVLQNVGLPLIKDPSKTRQFDVVLECPAGPRTFRLAIDVKDTDRALDVNEMAGLLDKRRKVALDRFLVFSRAGYSKEAREDAVNGNVELLSFERGAPVFAADVAEATSRTLKNFAITIYYDVNPDPLPPLAEIDEVLARIDGQPLRGLAELAHNDVQRVVNALNFPDGAPFDVRLDNRPGVMKELIVRDVRYPAPQVIVAKGIVCLQTVTAPAIRITTSEGHVAAAFVFPHNGDHSQVTLVGTPQPDGATQLAATLAPAKPSKTDLQGDVVSPLQVMPVRTVLVPGPPATSGAKGD